VHTRPHFVGRKCFQGENYYMIMIPISENGEVNKRIISMARVVCEGTTKVEDN
jgi:hypothetical protein